jgi:ribA/ribD-fused uncharacterized protein
MAQKPRQRDGFFLFWGQWPSNWTPSPFVLDGTTYNCVEQYMMAEKARLFGDTAALTRIMASADPRDQKRYGKQVSPYDDAKWAAVRYEIVLRATIAKYTQNPDLREKLLASGDLRFVEAAPDDVVWGIGMNSDHPDATNPARWRGTNLLGKALDEARATIRNAGG